MKYILLIVMSCFIVSTILFKKAAGTLTLGKINIISFVYYLFTVQTFAGTSLVMLGYDEHYTLKYLLNKEGTLKITFIVVMVTSVFLPLAIIFTQKLCRIKPKEMYNRYLEQKITVKNNSLAFEMICVGAFICVLLLAVFLVKIGYVPLLMLIKHPSEFEFALERARIGRLYVIHPYVSNIMVLGIIPLLSYISFSYALTVKSKRWYFLATILFLSTIIVKTYKFEKSPLLFHFLVYVLIYAYIKRGINSAIMTVLCGGGGVLLVLFYYLMGYEGALLDIYNGPLGRTLFTQVGTLMYVFDMFPNFFPFLHGRSLASTLLPLFGMSSEKHLRSAEIVMAFYGSEVVYDGGAGVMNTVFLGEAYANWGYAGIIVSIIWVAVVISLIFGIVLKLRKTPLTVGFLGVMTVKIGMVSQGGFYDFVYNVDLMVTIAVFLGGYYLLESNGPMRNKMMKIVEEKSQKLWCRLQIFKKR